LIFQTYYHRYVSRRIIRVEPSVGPVAPLRDPESIFRCQSGDAGPKLLDVGARTHGRSPCLDFGLQPLPAYLFAYSAELRLSSQLGCALALKAFLIESSLPSRVSPRALDEFFEE
jgi:hypothetical protein